MTTAVVTVGQDMRVKDVAKLILDKRISGTPVVDIYQNVISIVSEGDLIRRFEETGGGKPPPFLVASIYCLPGEADGGLCEGSRRSCPSMSTG